MKQGRNGGRLRRVIQAICLLLFLWLLWRTVFPLDQEFPPPDLFLRLDPLTAMSTPLAARSWLGQMEQALLGKVWPGLLVLILALVFGRVFCGYICPMGASLDLAHRLGGALRGNGATDRGAESPAFRNLRKVKFILLAVILGAAAAGLNLAWWGAPIPLITRFYALLAHPVLLLAGSESLGLLQPAFSSLDLTGLEYLQIGVRRFSTIYFLLLFFGLLFLLEQLRPRFWCRYLCPAGALLALFGRLPLWRRRVQACVQCGKCARQCPTGAIAESYTATAHGECLACRACVEVCPVQGIKFGFRSGEKKALPEAVDGLSGKSDAGPLPARRAFVAAAGGGVLMAAVGFSSSSSLLRAGGRGVLWPDEGLRPPGALPEGDFLARCLRCGACMKVCPSNALQPTWLEAGAEAMFSPLLVARRGPCEPECNACGRVCPTGAIRALPLTEKQWAKIGTAVVQPGRCLAFAEGRRCVVCQEVCPYGSIKLLQTELNVVPVPVVEAARCFGCGYCENHCPVRVPAITVLPLNALRLSGSNYRETGQSAGLRLELADQANEEPGQYQLPENGLPPGFTD